MTDDPTDIRSQSKAQMSDPSLEHVRPPADIEQLCINTIRTLAMDAVQKANSGHPGTPMGLAPLAYLLWTKYLKHNPRNPAWPNRDHFVMSAGHASMLLYAMLYLTGYDLSLDDIEQFRQWGSKTPGHPERGRTPGVEMTTGPLGQGISNAVGLTIAEHMLAARFNRPDCEIVDHYTYVIASDGDMMEGVSSEACSLAGHLRVGKLIVFYDANRITIEGSTDLAFSESVGDRFRAYGWNVLQIPDGNDLEEIDRVIAKARAVAAGPTLVVVRTHIAYGSPNKQDTAEAHGAPLGEEEVRLTKQNLGWPYEEPFAVPPEALEVFRRCVEKGHAAEQSWRALFDEYSAAYPNETNELRRVLLDRRLPDGWQGLLPTFPEGEKMATRSASGKMLNAVAAKIPELVGGSGDLAPSTDTLLKGYDDVLDGNFAGRNFHFGVREHGMAAILNGLAAHGGLRVYGATFLIFSDYMRPSIRLAALQDLPTIFVYTHDSVGLGEDGPTHQPIEHLASLRAIPNLLLLRPADANETAAAWRLALERTDGPTALVLTRQKLPVLRPNGAVEKGAYVMEDGSDVVLIGTGSEVSVCLEARRLLEEQGVSARVVSMPSWKLFREQSQAYRDEVLPRLLPHLAVEAASSLGWSEWADDVVAIDHFGASAPGEVLFEKYGFTPENVADRARKLVRR
jgi:transketolase